MDRLRRWIEDNDSSQTALAELVGVKQPSVWEWLEGKSMPSGKNLRRLSQVTGLSIDALLDSKPRLHTSRKAG